MATIKEFRGKYRFLSNFYPSPITIDGFTYPTVEHYFQAMKFTDPHIQEIIRTAATPAQAKKLPRRYQRRADWFDISLQVMESALRAKFVQPELRAALLATGDAELQEGNRWHDTFWGVDLASGTGENHLGKLLMKVRAEILNETQAGLKSET